MMWLGTAKLSLAPSVKASTRKPRFQARITPNTQVARAAQRNQNSASGAMCLDTAGFSSAGMSGITRIWTKLK